MVVQKNKFISGNDRAILLDNSTAKNIVITGLSLNAVPNVNESGLDKIAHSKLVEKTHKVDRTGRGVSERVPTIGE